MFVKKNKMYNSELVLLGKVVGVHGLSGNVKVNVLVEHMKDYTLQNGFILKSPDLLYRRKTFIKWKKKYKDRIYLFSFKDMDSREDAERVVGFYLYIKKKELPKLDKDTYFWIDLIGMAVKNKNGKFLGYLNDIICTGANDVYVIRNQTNKKFIECQNEILIPAIKSVIINVDILKSTMYVDLPEYIDY